MERRVSARGLQRRILSPILTQHAVLQRVAGKDASKQFWKYHNEGILKKYKAQLQVGSLDTKKAAAPPTPPATPPAEERKPKAVPQAKPRAAAAQEDAEAMDPFGSLIPFGDPNWYQGVSGLSNRMRWKSNNRPSTTLPTTMKPTLLSVQKSGNGSSPSSNPTLPNGTKERKFQIASTSKWVSEAIWLACSVCTTPHT